MTSDATAAFGTLLKIGDGGGPETFTTIAEVRDIAGPGLSQDTEEVTHHLSPGRYKEKIATLKEGGELTFDLNWLPNDATHDVSTGLLKDFEDGTRRNFQVVYASAPAVTWTIPCIVTGFEPDAAVGGVLEAPITLEVAGQPILA